MSFASALQEEKRKAIIEHAIQFAEEYEGKLIKAASEGFSSYRIDLSDREDGHILRNTDFTENVELLLDGCEVRIDKTEMTNIIFKNKYYKYFLIISWK